MELTWQLYLSSFVGCVVVAVTFFATVHPWQRMAGRVELFDWRYWLKKVEIHDLPREGEEMKPKLRTLWFPHLILGLVVGFAIVAIGNVFVNSAKYPTAFYLIWAFGFFLGPLMGNYMLYKGMVLRRHFVGWCYVVLITSLLGLETMMGRSYLLSLFERLPENFLGQNTVKMVTILIILFCWRAASEGFKNWKSDIRDVRDVAGMGPIPPEWTPHIAMNDLSSAMAAIIIAVLYVGA